MHDRAGCVSRQVHFASSRLLRRCLRLSLPLLPLPLLMLPLLLMLMLLSLLLLLPLSRLPRQGQARLRALHGRRHRRNA